jgi:sugar lactone lactonase YvrE
MFCAVPQGLPRGAGIYPEIAYQYPDNFYRVDLNSGVKTLLASPVGSEGAYSGYNLTVSADGTILYFTDRNSGTLQSIRLK